ncbi:MAG: DEAD/DEAH box helicase family protein [Planctomycetes bacterium]|nr:DEAD/DEAH box helicase family protein [Planctomycetota bacterium]
MRTIDRLIINSPYQEPALHWEYDRARLSFSLKEGRRQAGYIIATPNARAHDDPGIFVPIPLVNRIRPLVKAWRDAGYPGPLSSVTRRLLEYWRDPEDHQDRRFFFCQLEAIETLIWLTEGPEADRREIDVPSDGGPFPRWCCKMATGSGKTLVMAMAIAWQILNKVTHPDRAGFSKNVLVIAPGLTVKTRLAVLDPRNPGNYYKAFRIVPGDLIDRLRRGRVRVCNWHRLGWQSEEKVAKRKSVDKRGALSDEAYTRHVLRDLAGERDILVVNDEAHHAWRVTASAERAGVSREEIEDATKWIGGLDRVHATRGVLKCLDFTATPFVPSGKRSSEEALFQWIVSDFGLNDAIESGLVKTPRVVIRDDVLPDAKTLKSRLYHLYNDDEVHDDLNKRAEPEEPLPGLVISAYCLLGHDWREHERMWRENGSPTPPVMITVCNRTETAARVRLMFERNPGLLRQLFSDGLFDPANVLHIDTKVLKQAEARDEPEAPEEDDRAIESDADDSGVERKLTKTQREEALRRMVDTVGRAGQPGGQVQCVISVGMLSEGWDAKTVTHIMGLRAFSSQLLCEQVIGRGLRRVVYETKKQIDPRTGAAVEMFEPEYVNVFGVPFSFLPHEGGEGAAPKPEPPKTAIEPDPAKAEFAISWPNVVRVHVQVRESLALDLVRVSVLELDAADCPTIAELAPVVDGKPDASKISEINLDRAANAVRAQAVVFEVAQMIYENPGLGLHRAGMAALGRLVPLVEEFLRSDRLAVFPRLFMKNDSRRMLVLAGNTPKIANHLVDALARDSADLVEPEFDEYHPVRSTHQMIPWSTSRPCHPTRHSHVNFCVCDGGWESADEFQIDRHEGVAAWAKNDHLGFEIQYVFEGVVRKYRPDFLIRMKSGAMLIMETKGQDSAEFRAKRAAAELWARAVNENGGFGRWRYEVAFRPKEIIDILSPARAGG